MAKSIPAIQIAQRVQQLIDERQKHVDAIALIDQTLAGVGAALSGTGGVPTKAQTAVTEVKGSKRKRRRPGRSGFATTAEASILEFIKQNKNPTTAEIKKHWESEGRASSADNTLSLMVKNKKLKRTPLGEGIRGSRFSLP